MDDTSQEHYYREYVHDGNVNPPLTATTWQTQPSQIQDISSPATSFPYHGQVNDNVYPPLTATTWQTKPSHIQDIRSPATFFPSHGQANGTVPIQTVTLCGNVSNLPVPVDTMLYHSVSYHELVPDIDASMHNAPSRNQMQTHEYRRCSYCGEFTYFYVRQLNTPRRNPVETREYRFCSRCGGRLLTVTIAM